MSGTTGDPTAAVAARLGLAPHPEGGHYREVHRSPRTVRRDDGAERAAGTAILYLLGRDRFSAFHRVRGADEVWHLYEGGDLELHVLVAGEAPVRHRLSVDPERGARVAVVPADAWQAARAVGPAPHALCGCTVSPGFDFADFEMARRDALARAFPEARALVEALTR